LTGSRTLYLLVASAAASLPLAPAGGVAAHPGVLAQTQHTEGNEIATPTPAGTSIHRVASAARGALKGRVLRVALGGSKAAQKNTAAWLPKGCKLVELGPLTQGINPQQICTPPRGMRLPRGYVLVRGSIAPKAHTTTGASG
jgi:hypothetical protein